MAIKTGYLGTYTVSGGSITVNNAVVVAQMGLAYTSTVKPMKLDIAGLGILTTKRISKAIISFYKTLGGKFGSDTSTLDTVTFRDTGDKMDASPSFFTGEKELSFPGGYEKEGNIIIEQEQPLPMIVRSISMDISAETG